MDDGWASVVWDGILLGEKVFRGGVLQVSYLGKGDLFDFCNTETSYFLRFLTSRGSMHFFFCSFFCCLGSRKEVCTLPSNQNYRQIY